MATSLKGIQKKLIPEGLLFGRTDSETGAYTPYDFNELISILDNETGQPTSQYRVSDYYNPLAEFTSDRQASASEFGAGDYERKLNAINAGDYVPNNFPDLDIDAFSNKQLYENILRGIIDQSGEKYKLPSEEIGKLAIEAVPYDPNFDYRTQYDESNPDWKTVESSFYDKIPQLKAGKDAYDQQRKAGFKQRLGIGAGLFLGGVGALGGFDGLFNSVAGSGTGGLGASLDPLLSESFLADGLLSSSELSSVLGAEQASLLGGASELAKYGLPENFNFADYVEYPNLTGQVEGPINSLGGASNSLGDILKFGIETGNLGPLFDKIGSSLNPLSSGSNALGNLGSAKNLFTLAGLIGGGVAGGSGGGGGNNSVIPSQPPAQPAPTNVYPSSGSLIPDFSMLNQRRNNVEPVYIPEYLRRGVIGR